MGVEGLFSNHYVLLFDVLGVREEEKRPQREADDVLEDMDYIVELDCHCYVSFLYIFPPSPSLFLSELEANEGGSAILQVI